VQVLSLARDRHVAIATTGSHGLQQLLGHDRPHQGKAVALCKAL
jgi:hypothetical protein